MWWQSWCAHFVTVQNIGRICKCLYRELCSVCTFTLNGTCGSSVDKCQVISACPVLNWSQCSKVSLCSFLQVCKVVVLDDSNPYATWASYSGRELLSGVRAWPEGGCYDCEFRDVTPSLIRDVTPLSVMSLHYPWCHFLKADDATDPR
jgi:hypothetical protein